jgi:CRISPR-associated protein Csm4
LLTKVIDKKVVALNLKAIQRQKVWVESVVPRVTVDRVSNTSEIFHTGRIQFAAGCGLWFGAHWLADDARASFEETLQVLGDSGLGAERSAGYGSFRFSRTEKTLPIAEAKSNGLLYLLSRYYPENQADAESLLRDDAAFDLAYVAGRTQAMGTANQRRRGARLVVEGSVIGGGATGALADVTPTVGSFPHKVYRYGYALGIGLEQ